jgi:CelD/BcsL family acetyltransferase involved in cellulose biosynthesis
MEQGIDVERIGALSNGVDRLVVYAGTSVNAAGALENGVSTAFQSPAWLASWRRHVGAALDCTPVRAVAYKGSGAVMDLSLVLKPAFGIRVLAWQADELNDYCGPVAEPSLLASLSEADVRALLGSIAEAAGGADAIWLQKQVRSYGALPNPFVSASAIPYHIKSHAVAWTQSWMSHYAGSRSTKTRRRLKDKLRALQKRGELVIRLSESEAEARALVARGIEMKAAQLAKAGHWNPFESAAVQSHLIEYFGDRTNGETWVAVLELDGRPLAVSFGFRDAERWLLYQIAMEIGPLAQFSPGTHLLMFLLHASSKAGVQLFDLSIGDESYKLQWCNVTQELMSDVFPLTLRGAAVSPLIRLSDHIRLAIAARPALLQHAKRLMNRLRLLRGPRAGQKADDGRSHV